MNNILSVRLTKKTKVKPPVKPVKPIKQVKPVKAIKAIRPVKQENKKNMEWGTVTWRLFHWLAANINEEFYIKSRAQLHSIIINILYNLPCPTCKSHAIEFSKKQDIRRATNKAQFIQYFYFFHNKVNERKGFKIPDRSILEEYTKMNGTNVINEWVSKFKNNLGINLNDFMNKQNIAEAKQRMINFITENRAQFTSL